MARTPHLLLLLLLLSVAVPAPAVAQDPPPLAATLAGCNAGPSAKERFAVFTASMPALRGTDRMAMRFDLEERRLKRWLRADVPRFGRWERSQRGRAGFVYTKRLERLRVGASYRAVVRFRWYDAEGHVQRSATRRTAVCDQPDQRPDLRVVLFELEPAGERTRHLVTVVNDGATAAGRFDVDVDSPQQDASRSVPGLAPGDRITVALEADRCTEGEQLVARVDAGGAVDEADEADNESVRLCA